MKFTHQSPQKFDSSSACIHHLCVFIICVYSSAVCIHQLLVFIFLQRQHQLNHLQRQLQSIHLVLDQTEFASHSPLHLQSSVHIRSAFRHLKRPEQPFTGWHPHFTSSLQTKPLVALSSVARAFHYSTSIPNRQDLVALAWELATGAKHDQLRRMLSKRAETELRPLVE